MTRVVIADFADRTNRELDVERSILGADVEIVRHCYDGSEERLISACKDADVILADCTPLPRSVLEKLPQCRLISFAATGYDCVDLEAASDANISVCAIDEYCTEEVADHSLMLMLTLSRRLMELHDQVQKEYAWQFDNISGISRMQDMTLGIIGFGRIGQAVARRARGFRMNIIAHDHHPADNIAAEFCVQFRNFEELLAESDIISLNCGLADGNEHMIDAAAFRKMKRRPIFINCARGGLVDEKALVESLDSGLISGAGIDVLSDESTNLRMSGLTGRSNVILTPHVAFYSDASILESRKISARNIRNFLDADHGDVRRYVHHAES